MTTRLTASSIAAVRLNSRSGTSIAFDDDNVDTRGRTDTLNGRESALNGTDMLTDRPVTQKLMT